MSSDSAFFLFLFFVLLHFIIHSVSPNTFTRFFSSWKSCWPGHCVCGTHRLCYSILKTHPCLAIDFRMSFKVFYLVLCNLASFYLLTKSLKLSNLKKKIKKQDFFISYDFLSWPDGSWANFTWIHSPDVVSWSDNWALEGPSSSPSCVWYLVLVVRWGTLLLF